MLQATHIHFCIRQRPIVREASMEVKPGEIMAILGPNGAGKSTLFRLLAGELKCTRGKINYNGASIEGLKPKELATVRAVMPQHSTVNFPFTAQEVIELGNSSHQASHPEKNLQEVMKLTQTSFFKDSLYQNLSGGEKQRVQLARVLLQIWEKKPFPRYLLLDEPTSSLDISQQHLVLNILQKLKNQNIGILVILHDLNLAAHYADRIALLKDGQVAAIGKVKEVFKESLLSDVFDHPIRLIHHLESDQVLVSSNEFYNYPLKTTKQA
ncbi:heme ABC transporter ATP-binding protein [Algoriphagus hitonicola]|uniref:Iron complex transport system ATP-binding protein n=1 Tax=Algoriphagus hitonicola TaxID=435880 RepID=A0A1I2U869_9BACT|nr:heme ABC transporter ATP-binding protein [Algoriphagus hitonicola]SFG71867.1 iron complex transport system ATP-binding protein [Algoriphagus hitonicola]